MAMPQTIPKKQSHQARKMQKKGFTLAKAGLDMGWLSLLWRLINKSRATNPHNTNHTKLVYRRLYCRPKLVFLRLIWYRIEKNLTQSVTLLTLLWKPLMGENVLFQGQIWTWVCRILQYYIAVILFCDLWKWKLKGDRDEPWIGGCIDYNLRFCFLGGVVDEWGWKVWGTWQLEVRR